MAGSRAASAADPLNSSDKTSASASAPDREAHTDVNIVPALGGTTDIGFGGGYFSGITRARKGVDPYLWNLESSGIVTFKPADGGVDVPYQDVYAKLVVPRLLGPETRVEIRPSYTYEATLGYYGMGNASSSSPPPGASSSYFWYARRHPALYLDVRTRVVDHLAAVTGLRYVQNWVDVPGGSKLADDMRSGSDEVKRLIGSTAPHAVALFHYGMQWDSRDSEVSPHHGSFVEARLFLSPGGSGLFAYRYGQANVTARTYLPLSRKAVLALRGVADVLFGDPPFYELSRFDDTYALGGSSGVRGIPAQHYYGKVKLFGNVELRHDITSFHALGKSLLLGAVGFFDAGRLWADLSPHPELDGSGLGLKWGVGTGLRLQSGETFVMRGDVAWSPDSQPLGGYLAAEQMF
ncbi:MAG TPA: BamA/TamA family outer membrane protein [Polyangiaceae bacterium]